MQEQLFPFGVPTLQARQLSDSGPKQVRQEEWQVTQRPSRRKSEGGQEVKQLLSLSWKPGWQVVQESTSEQLRHGYMQGLHFLSL
jgi:hypothetical protein